MSYRLCCRPPIWRSYVTCNHPLLRCGRITVVVSDKGVSIPYYYVKKDLALQWGNVVSKEVTQSGKRAIYIGWNIFAPNIY